MTENLKSKHIKLSFIGKMCSGKTTLSNFIQNYLKNKYNIHFERQSFAGKVYELCYDLFNMDRHQKDRKLLQTVGTLMRSIDENVWVNYTIRQCQNKNIIVEDCRYLNEYESLKENGFVFIKINIDPEFQKERLIHTYPETYMKHLNNLNHASELDIDRIPDDECHIVFNARDNEEIFDKMQIFIDNYISNHIELDN